MAEIALRPMTLGEVLDHTFSLYKRNFWLFAGIVALPYLLVVVFSFFFSSSLGTALPAPGSAVSPADASRLLGALFGTLAVFLLFYLVVFAVAQAATVMAVSDLYLGRSASVAESFTRVRGRYLTVLLAMVLAILVSLAPVALIAALIPLAARGGVVAGGAVAVLMLPALIVMVVLYCRMALAVPVATLEPRGSGGAIVRSIRLTKGSAWWIFAVYVLVAFLTYLAVAVFQGPFLLAVGNPLKPHTLPLGIRVLQGVASWVSGVIVAPIGTIAFSLIYYNQRVRKEAFDLEQLMASLGPADTPPTPTTA